MRNLICIHLGVTNKFFYRIYSVFFLVCFFLFCLIKTFSLILFTSLDLQSNGKGQKYPTLSCLRTNASYNLVSLSL